MFNGVNCGAFAYLEPDYVASEVVKAVLLNKELVVLPGLLLVAAMLLKQYVMPLTFTARYCF